MDFYTNGQYSGLKEVMYYYHWNFYVYYILALIVLINSIKAIISFVSYKNGSRSNTDSGYYELAISILSGMGLMCGTVFHGILTDIPSSDSHIWWNRLFILSIIAFVLFIIQLVFTLRKNKL